MCVEAGVCSSYELARLRSNVWKVCLVRAFAVSMAFSMPTIVLYWQQKGIDLSTVFGLEAVFAAVWLLFDVPCGYFADRYGRRLSMIVGSLIMLLGGISYCVADGLSGFLYGEILLALGNAFIAGADQALLRSSLHELGEDGRFHKLWGRVQCSEMSAATVMSLLGGWLFMQAVLWPIYAATVGYVFLVAISLSLFERKGMAFEEAGAKSVARLVTFGGECLLHNRRIAWCIWFSALLLGALQSSVWLFNRYMESSGIGSANAGWVFAMLGTVAAVFALNANHLQLRVARGWMCGLLLLVLSVAFFGLAAYAGWYGLGLLAMIQPVRGVARVVFVTWIKEEVAKELFATALSLQSMVFRASYVLWLLLLRSQADILSIGACFALLGTCVIIGGVTLLRVHPWRVPPE